MINFFIKNSIILASVEFIVRAKSLIFMSLMTFYLGPEKFGTWSQVVAIAAFFVPFVILGTDAAIFRYLPGSDRFSQLNYFQTWLASSLGACIFVALLLSFFSTDVSIYLLGSAENSEYIMLVPLILASNTLVNSVKIWFRIINDIKTYSYFISLSALASLSLGFILITYQFTLYQIILYLSSIDICTSIVALFWIYRGQVFFILPNIQVLVKLVRYGAPLFFSGFAMWGLNYVDRFLLPNYVSIKEVGIYTLAYQLGSMATQTLTTPIWTQFQGIVTSEFNGGDKSKYQDAFDFLMIALLLVCVPLVIALLVMSQSILLLFAPSGFLEGVYVLPLIALSYVFHMLASCYEVVIGLYHKQKILTYTSFFILLINFFSNLILIPLWGFVGAALATLLSFFVQFVFAYVLAQRYHYVRFGFKVFIKILAASLLMGCGLVFAESVVPTSSLWTVLKIVFGVLLYCTLILSFRVFPFQSFKYIRLLMK